MLKSAAVASGGAGGAANFCWEESPSPSPPLGGALFVGLDVADVSSGAASEAVQSRMRRRSRVTTIARARRGTSESFFTPYSPGRIFNFWHRYTTAPGNVRASRVTAAPFVNPATLWLATAAPSQLSNSTPCTRVRGGKLAVGLEACLTAGAAADADAEDEASAKRPRLMPRLMDDDMDAKEVAAAEVEFAAVEEEEEDGATLLPSASSAFNPTFPAWLVSPSLSSSPTPLSSFSLILAPLLSL
mmetsp:Transcript_62940/g.126226  ORF Transcript_62940/g.126226 Transcript_62940/m.126226 type:complete len:244 (-) Transcript_62940:276-1007(-)